MFEFYNYKIAQNIFKVIEEICENKLINLSEETILSELPMNSMSFVQFIITLENIFEIEFDDEALDINRFRRIKDLMEYIKNVKNKH